MKSPLDILLPYQRKWVDDSARFKIGMWARQTGKSFTTSAEAVAGAGSGRDDMWVVLSAGERQALEWMEKAKMWTEAFGVAIEEYIETREGGPQTMIKSAEIRFPNKGRILAIPANPNTARGYSANLILDEFAFHERPNEIWRAIFPSISNPLTGEKKLRIVSTPKGRGNMFYELWTKNDSYSKHKITIFDAIAGGLKVNAEELRKSIDDPDAWAQEYLCEFIDATAVLLPYDMIAGCEEEGKPTDYTHRYLGVDIGRRHDFTVIWELCQVGDLLWTGSVEVLDKVEFHTQLDVLSARMADPAVKCCAIDATGIGAMLAEELRRKCGSRVMECTFTNTFKGEIFTALRRRMEERTIRIPIDRDIREDLHAMQKIVGNNGDVRYAAPRSSDGHSDRAAALALAVHAATEKHSDPIEYIPENNPFQSGFGSNKFSGGASNRRLI